MTVTVDMSELEGIADLLRAEPALARIAASAATVTVGSKVQSQAKAAAPRDRPWLATDGIRRKTWQDETGTHTDIFTVPDDEGRPVGMFVEYGTSKMPPQPFLTIQAVWAETAYPLAIEAKIEPLRGVS